MNAIVLRYLFLVFAFWGTCITLSLGQSTCEAPCSRNECGGVDFDVIPVDSLACEGANFRFRNRTAIGTYTGLVIRWGDGKQDTVYQLNDFFHKYDLPASLKASCQTDTIIRLTVCITAFKQCNEGYTCSQKVQSFPVRISLKPKAAFVASRTTACVGSRISFRNTTCFSSGAFYAWRYSTFRITNVQDINLDYDQPGIYDVELAAVNRCGADTLKQQITILRAPVAQVRIDSLTSCFPAVLRLRSAEPANSDASWTISGDTSVWEQINTFPSIDSAWIRFKKLGAITIQMRVANGCGTDSVFLPYVLKATPFFKIDSEVNLCQEGFVSPASLFFTYDSTRISNLLWRIANENPRTVSGASFTPAYFRRNGTIELQTTGSCGVFRHTIRVQVFPRDTIRLGSRELSLCTNAAPIQLTATPSGGRWSGFGITPEGRLDPALFRNLVRSTVYYETAGPNCSVRDSVSLQITQAVTVALAPVGPLCEGEEFTPRYTVTGSYTGVNGYVRGGIPASFQGLNPGVIRFPVVGTYGIKVEALSTCGTIFDTVTVRVVSRPQPESFSASPACVGESSRVRLALANRDGESVNVKIFIANTLLLDTTLTGRLLDLPVRVLLGSGRYTMRAVLSKGERCQTETSTELVLSQKPTLALSPTNVFCSNTLFTPSLNASGTFDSFRWSFPGGNPAVGSGQAPGRIRYTLSGRYLVKVEGTGPCGVAVDSLFLQVIEQPQITRFSATPVCLGRTSSVKMTWSNLSGTPVRVQLRRSGTAVLDTTLRGNVLDYALRLPDLTGRYPLSLTTQAGEICRADSATEVLVYTSPPVSILGLSPISCVKSAGITLRAEPMGGIFSGTGVSRQTDGTYTLPPGIKDSWIYYDYTDSGGCRGRDSQFIREVRLSPVLRVEDVFPLYCRGDAWQSFKALPAGGTFELSLLPLEMVNRDQGLFRFRPLSSGEFFFKYRYSDAVGCSDSITIPLKITDRFPFDPATDTVIFSGQKLVLGKPAVPGYTYLWFDGSIQSTLTVTDPGLYTVSVSNPQNNCAVVDTVRVSFGGVNALVDPLLAMNLMDILPNPFAREVLVRFRQAPGIPLKLRPLRVLNGIGQIVKQVTIEPGQTELLLQLGNLPDGIYWLDGYGRARKMIKSGG